MSKSIGLLLFFSIVLFSCSSKKTKIHELAWIEGEWTTIFHGKTISERWELQGDSIWIGNTSLIREGQSYMTEEMSIELKDGKYLFSTSVANQNEGRAITFTLKEQAGKRLVFENPKHDFPQLITYELKSEKELHAFISGTNLGEETRMDFNYKKSE